MQPIQQYGQRNRNRLIGTRIEAWLRREQRHTAILEIPELEAAIGTTTGEVRKDNQDRSVGGRISFESATRTLTVFAICDGLGGMVEGGRCAEKALSTFLDSLVHSRTYNLKDRMRDAILAANQEVFRQYRQRGGTTLAVLCHNGESHIGATVGDTRLYALSPKLPLKQVSIDDTVAGELSRIKDVSPANLERFANQLAQFIGVGSDLDPRFYELPTRTDTTYFLASDGAYNIGTAFEALLANAPSPLVAVQRIIQTSRWMGGKDNASIICVGPHVPQEQRLSDESLLELWDATSKLEIPLESRPTTFEPKQVPVTSGKGPTPKQKDRNRRRKARQVQGERPVIATNKPTLQIDFGEPTPENKSSDSPSNSGRTQHDQPKASMSDVGDTPTVDDRIDGAHRRNIQDS